jgi:phage tail tape-measure protein
MKLMAKIVTAALAAAFATAMLGASGEARTRRGVEQSRQVKKARLRHRVAQRPVAAYEAAPGYAPVAAYGGLPLSAKPYGGPGRAYFEPPSVGAAPDRAESRSPEGR